MVSEIYFIFFNCSVPIRKVEDRTNSQKTYLTTPSFPNDKDPASEWFVGYFVVVVVVITKK